MACLLCVPQSQHFLGSSEPGALATGGTAPVADAPGSERIISVKRPRAAKHSGDPTHRGGVRFRWHGRRRAWRSGGRAVQGARLHAIAREGCWLPEAVPAVSTHYRAGIRVAQRGPHAPRAAASFTRSVKATMEQTTRTFAALGLVKNACASRYRVCSSVSGTGVEPVTPRSRVWCSFR